MCSINTLPRRATRTRRRVEEHVAGTPYRPYDTLHGIVPGEVDFLRNVTHGARFRKKFRQRTGRFATAVHT
eukprot:12191544-Alexandrium_andersonii.AAC.1